MAGLGPFGCKAAPSPALSTQVVAGGMDRSPASGLELEQGRFWGFTGSCKGLCFRMGRTKLCKTSPKHVRPPCHPCAPFLAHALDFFNHFPIAFILCAWKCLHSWWPFFALMDCGIAAPFGRGPQRALTLPQPLSSSHLSVFTSQGNEAVWVFGGGRMV